MANNDGGGITLPRWLSIERLLGFITGAGLIVAQWYVLNDRIAELGDATKALRADVALLSARIYVLERNDSVNDERLKAINESLMEIRRQLRARPFDQQ